MILFVPLTFVATLAAGLYAAPPWWAALLALGLGLALLVFSRRAWQVIVAMSLLACCLALFRAELVRQSAESPFSRLVSGERVLSIRGAVIDEPVPRDRAQQVRLRVDAAQRASGAWVVTRGEAQLTAPPTVTLRYGEVIEVRGKVEAPEVGAPPGYAGWLRRQGIDAVVGFPQIKQLGEEMGDPLYARVLALRQALARPIEAYLPEPHAALEEGTLIGLRASIPKTLNDAFNQSGTAALIAISG